MFSPLHLEEGLARRAVEEEGEESQRALGLTAQRLKREKSQLKRERLIRSGNQRGKGGSFG